MNKFIEAEDYVMFYQNGKLYNKVQYVKFTRRDQEYLRYMYSMLYGHIKEYKNLNPEQRGLYNWFFTEDQKHLPRPTRIKGKVYNTWATFLEGLEDNFATGTDNFTTKHLEGVQEAVNFAVEYFTNVHSSFEPMEQAPTVNIVPANKAYMMASV